MTSMDTDRPVLGQPRTTDPLRHHNAQLALEYASRGFAVFPCWPDNTLEHSERAKTPAVGKGFHRASADLVQVRNWWRNIPGALVGLPCTERSVLDLDIDETTNDIQPTVDRVCRTLGLDNGKPFIEACSLLVASPSGGIHFHWARVPGLAVPNDASVTDIDVDRRGHDANGKPRGYIIAPLTVLPDGQDYEVVRGDPFDKALAEPPEWLLWYMFRTKADIELISKQRDNRLAKLLESVDVTEWRSVITAAEEARRKAAPIRVVSDADAEPYRKQGLDTLETKCRELAAMSTGRHDGAYKTALAFAWYVVKGYLKREEAETAFLDAWAACGGKQRRGENHGIEQFNNALKYAARFVPPPIARRFRHCPMNHSARSHDAIGTYPRPT